MFAGPGQSDVATQLADLALNAVIGLLLIALLRRFVARAPQTLRDARRGASRAITPFLARALAGPVALLQAPDANTGVEELTPAERAVLELLAAGRAPKQVARELSVTLATVRSHIAAGNRKTGSRTVEQFVATYAGALVAG